MESAFAALAVTAVAVKGTEEPLEPPCEAARVLSSSRLKSIDNEEPPREPPQPATPDTREPDTLSQPDSCPGEPHSGAGGVAATAAAAAAAAAAATLAMASGGATATGTGAGVETPEAGTGPGAGAGPEAGDGQAVQEDQQEEQEAPWVAAILEAARSGSLALARFQSGNVPQHYSGTHSGAGGQPATPSRTTSGGFSTPVEQEALRTAVSRVTCTSEIEPADGYAPGGAPAAAAATTAYGTPAAAAGTAAASATAAPPGRVSSPGAAEGGAHQQQDPVQDAAAGPGSGPVPGAAGGGTPVLAQPAAAAAAAVEHRPPAEARGSKEGRAGAQQGSGPLGRNTSWKHKLEKIMDVVVCANF